MWPKLLAGLLGGLVCGAVDAGAGVVMAGARAGWLIPLGMGMGAAAGVLLAGMVALLQVGASATFGESFAARDRFAGALAALFASPLVVYDAFAMFGGPSAARIPGHQFLSVMGAAVVVAGVYALGRRYARAVGPTAARASVPLLILAVALAAGALGVYVANRALLPRLYHWFHASLSAVFLTLCVLSAHAFIVWFQLGSRRALLGLGVFLAALLALSLPRLMASQVVRFAAFDKTLVVSLVLSALPVSKFHRPSGAAKPPLPGASATLPLPPGPHRPNADVVLVTIDALRADHVGAYGYGRPTTPHIDEWARGSVRFARAYAQAPHTSFSVASMLTGKYYPTIARLAPGDRHDPVTEILRQYGWKTAAFYPPAVFYVDADKLRAYQENNFEFEYVKVEFLDAFARVAQIADYFTTVKPERVFLWLHLFEPHEPYDQRGNFDFGKRDIDRYDSEVAYADAAVGRLLAYVKAHRPGAIVIIAADHGEEFDEDGHKGRYHGSTLYEEQIRVPLMIAVPGVPAHVIGSPVQLVDLAPTILGLLDMPIPARMRGTDLGPWLATPPAPESALPPAFAEVENMRMVAWGREKLTCMMNWGYCSYYDLSSDPGEKKNLADESPARVAALRAKLDEWLDEHSRYEPQLLRGHANPEGGMVPKAIERGRLGDYRAAPELAAMLLAPEALPMRREAARLLVALPANKSTMDTIRAALAVVEDPDLKNWISVAAARLGDSVAQKYVRKIVEGAPEVVAYDRDLRVRAALALGAVGDPAAVPVLAATLDECPSVEVCRLVILALGTIRDPGGAAALLKHLAEVQNRREMVASLGQIGDQPGVAEALAGRLHNDEYVTVRAEAAFALAAMGGRYARHALESSLAHEQEKPVLIAVQAGLQALSKTKSNSGTAGSPRRQVAR